MQDYQQRVVEEKTDLDGKIDRLAAFSATPVFSGLDNPEKDRMLRQLETMRHYSKILGERIAAFT